MKIEIVAETGQVDNIIVARMNIHTKKKWQKVYNKVALITNNGNYNSIQDFQQLVKKIGFNPVNSDVVCDNPYFVMQIPDGFIFLPTQKSVINVGMVPIDENDGKPYPFNTVEVSFEEEYDEWAPIFRRSYYVTVNDMDLDSLHLKMSYKTLEEAEKVFKKLTNGRKINLKELYANGFTDF